ncbi:PLP-dependent aminotransferase family protein [Neobacillus niacini]|uniref:MocR-like pyridoxine biosynthesis transcription factor PdxR n=1 Tax=Neobacillus niacini TaxID=86668 RepID=UPI002FFF0636
MIILLNSDSPHYLQIYHHIKREIISENLQLNDKLPSIRKLAKFLNISTTPVELAYQLLLSEGFVESRPRAGYFVQKIPAPYTRLEIQKDDKLSSTTSYPSRDENKYLYDFHISKIDRSVFPTKTWKKLFSEALTDEHFELDYGNPQGEKGLRQEIANYLHHFRGVRCFPDQIVIAGDQSFLIFILSSLLLQNYRELAIENPGYMLVPSLFQRMGYTILPLSLDNDGINIHHLEESGSRLVVTTPSYQFPTGTMMSLERRIALLEWANKTNGYIIEDDYDGEFRYYGEPLPSLQGLDPNTNVIYLGGFSQVLAPAISIHYMVLPENLLEDYHRLRIELMLEQSSSRMQQKTLQRFIEEGFLAKHVRKLRQLYMEKHDKLVSSLEKYLSEKVTVVGSGAGFHIVIQVNDCRTSDELVTLAKGVGVRVINGAFYWSKPLEFSPTIMIGFAGIPLHSIDDGIKTLASAWFPNQK